MSAALVASTMLLILEFVSLEAVPGLEAIGLKRMFTDASWHPAEDAARGRFNIGPMIVGTLAASLGAVALAAPIGVASAVFSCFYAPAALARWHRRLVELLAGVPSVVFGFWGLVVLTPLIRQLAPPGQSLLAAILVLALMILPTIALLAEAALRAVPTSYLRGASALGVSRAGMVWGIAVPAARSGLVTAVVLATGRAIGETMAVLMVAGNIVQLPSSLFDPARMLTANIALELGYAAGDHRAALFVTGFVLLAMTMLLVAMAASLTRGRNP